jgi:hypothetical protein
MDFQTVLERGKKVPEIVLTDMLGGENWRGPEDAAVFGANALLKVLGRGLQFR